jgi:hypothetical protein
MNMASFKDREIVVVVIARAFAITRQRYEENFRFKWCEIWKKINASYARFRMVSRNVC